MRRYNTIKSDIKLQAYNDYVSGIKLSDILEKYNISNGSLYYYIDTVKNGNKKKLQSKKQKKKKSIKKQRGGNIETQSDLYVLDNTNPSIFLKSSDEFNIQSDSFDIANLALSPTDIKNNEMMDATKYINKNGVNPEISKYTNNNIINNKHIIEKQMNDMRIEKQKAKIKQLLIDEQNEIKFIENMDS